MKKILILMEIYSLYSAKNEILPKCLLGKMHWKFNLPALLMLLFFQI